MIKLEKTNNELAGLLSTDLYQIDYLFDKERDMITGKFFMKNKNIGEAFDVFQVKRFKPSFKNINMNKMYYVDQDEIFPELTFDVLAEHFTNIVLCDMYTNEILTDIIRNNVKLFDEKFNEKSEISDSDISKVLSNIYFGHKASSTVVKKCNELVKYELENNPALTRDIAMNYISRGNCLIDGYDSIPNTYIILITNITPTIFKIIKENKAKKEE